MDLKLKLMDDMKIAMREKKTIMKDAIMMARAAIKQYEVDNRKDADDSTMIEIIAREIKKRRESIIEFVKAKNEKAVADLNEEIEVLLVYLPEQLNETQIREIVEKAIEEVGATSAKDMGKVMQNLKPKTVGKADGRLVSEVVKEMLNK